MHLSPPPEQTLGMSAGLAMFVGTIAIALVLTIMQMIVATVTSRKSRPWTQGDLYLRLFLYTGLPAGSVGAFVGILFGPWFGAVAALLAFVAVWTVLVRRGARSNA